MSKIICIDPGHGGRDPGAIGGGVEEKDLALAIAQVVADSLRPVAGYTVMMTRDKDEYLALSLRASKANMAKADLFVSIHINAADSTAAKGIETFSVGSEKGTLLAKCIQDVLMDTFADRKDRGVKQADFTVLTHTRMPAALVECGFITNDEERLWMQGHIGSIGVAIATGIRRYFGEELPGVQPNKYDMIRMVLKDYVSHDHLDMAASKVLEVLERKPIRDKPSRR